MTEALYDNARLKEINLGKNLIGNYGARILSDMMYCNKNLTVLLLHWNYITGTGAGQLFDAIAQSESQILIFDISFNPIGSNHTSNPENASNVKVLQQMFIVNKNLIHLDLSHCGFTKSDCALMNLGLTENHTLLGIHMTGNEAGINYQGYLSIEPE